MTDDKLHDALHRLGLEFPAGASELEKLRLAFDYLTAPQALKSTPESDALVKASAVNLERGRREERARIAAWIEREIEPIYRQVSEHDDNAILRIYNRAGLGCARLIAWGIARGECEK